MPFQSEAQRKFMWANHPEIAQRWSNEGKGYVAGKNNRSRGEREQVETHGPKKGTHSQVGMPAIVRAAKKRLGAEDDASVPYNSAKTGGRRYGPMNRMVPGDTRIRKGQRNY